MKCHWWEHEEARALRGALIELFESWKDLNRVCVETAFQDSDGVFKETQKNASRAYKRTQKILKKTAIKL